MPYALKASDNLLKKFDEIKRGITLTATGFYAPQTRELRLKSSVRDLYDKIKDFKYNNCDITNFEMETSALYFLGKSRGHNTLLYVQFWVIGLKINKVKNLLKQ